MSNFLTKVFGFSEQDLDEKVNKTGVDMQLVDELKLSMSDEDITTLT